MNKDKAKINKCLMFLLCRCLIIVAISDDNNVESRCVLHVDLGESKNLLAYVHTVLTCIAYSKIMSIFL